MHPGTVLRSAGVSSLRRLPARGIVPHRVEVGTPVARRPPAQIPACPIRGTGLFVLARFLRPQEGWPVVLRHSYGMGCLCELHQHVGPFTSVGACALPLATMSRSYSLSTLRPRSLSLRDLTCLARVVRAAGIPRASSVPCAIFDARHALGPRQALGVLTLAVVSVLGSGGFTPSPLAAGSFEAQSLKQEAGPTGGSRLPGGPLLAGRSVRGRQPRFLSIHRATLGLGRSGRPFIQFFRSEPWQRRHQAWGTFTPDCAQLLRALQS